MSPVGDIIIYTMKKNTSTQRNKEISKQKLIEAVGYIILREGFNGVGINAIAKEANLDKVLIYRYFGGLNGLLKAFAKQKDFYMNISNRLHDEFEKVKKSDLKSLIVEILITQLRDLRNDRELQELMLWEMMEKNELTVAIAKEREEKGYELSTKLKSKMDLTDGETDAIMALLVSGIYYLVLRSKTVDMFNGVELTSENGWQQIENAIKQIVNSYFE